MSTGCPQKRSRMPAVAFLRVRWGLDKETAPDSSNFHV